MPDFWGKTLDQWLESWLPVMKESASQVLSCPGDHYRMLLKVIDALQARIGALTAVATAARDLVERIRELEGDGAYGPELGRLIEALKAGEEANRS